MALAMNKTVENNEKPPLKPVSAAPEWRTATAPVAYPDALATMEERVAAIEAGTAPELFWFLEHPPLYTAGTSADPAELVDATRFPVFETGRGGRYTYHGPGQRVVYAVCDLRKYDRDVRQHVWRLEEWVILTLNDFGVKGERRAGRIGIWVTRELPRELSGAVAVAGSDPEHSSGERTAEQSRPTIVEEKIAAIGVRVRHWVAFHGLALNVNPDLSHFSGIVPCGIAEYGVTSLHALGIKATMAEVDAAFRRHHASLFTQES